MYRNEEVKWPTEHPLDRFWSCIEKTDKCWIWRGIRDTKGYGIFIVGGFFSNHVFLSAHRFMLTLVRDKVCAQDIHHICKNPSCVNPDHLLPVSRKEHMQLEPRGKKNGNRKN